jgi:hypothetical protein
MMKSFVIAATSIAWMLSLVDIAAAGDRHQHSRHSKPQLNLIKPKADTLRSIAVPQKDLQGIEQAITELYKNRNKEPKAPTYTGAHTFYEAKEISVVSFDKDGANIKIVETEQTYSFRGISTQLVNGKYRYAYSKSAYQPVVRTIDYSLRKKTGKWVVR